MPNHRIFKLLVAGALCLLCACWQPQKFHVLRVVPNALFVPGITTLAIGEMNGLQGEALGHLVAQRLAEGHFHKVLDWSSPHGLGAGAGGWADNDDGWQTADGALLGTLAPAEVAQSFAVHPSVDAQGVSQTQVTRTTVVSVRGHFRLIQPDTGRELTGATVTGCSGPIDETRTVQGPWDFRDDKDDNHELNKLFAPLEPTEPLNQALMALLDKLTETLGYSLQPAMVTLYHDPKEPVLSHALGEGQYGRWDAALAAYDAVLLQFDGLSLARAAQVHFNHGVALAMAGDVCHGIQEVRAAVQMGQQRPMQQMLDQLLLYEQESGSGQTLCQALP